MIAATYMYAIWDPATRKYYEVVDQYCPDCGGGYTDESWCDVIHPYSLFETESEAISARSSLVNRKTMLVEFAVVLTQRKDD
jgi:hypothetical protein